MVKHLKYALAIFLTIAFTEMNAQVTPGYVFGMNLSGMTMKNKGINYDNETSIGFHFGGLLEIPLNDNFALQPALLFSAKGSDYKIDSLDYTISPVYIEVPVNVFCSFGSDALKISLFAGPYFACGIGGYKIDSGGALQNISYGSGENNDLKPLDIGFNFGAGVSIKGILISVQYGIGMANISPVATSDSEIKNKVLAISISSGSKGLNTTFGK